MPTKSGRYAKGDPLPDLGSSWSMRVPLDGMPYRLATEQLLGVLRAMQHGLETGDLPPEDAAKLLGEALAAHAEAVKGR